MADHSSGSTSLTRDIVGYRQEVARYRRRPGGWWFLALVGVPLALTLVDAATSQTARPQIGAPQTTTSMVAPSSTAATTSAPTADAPASTTYTLTRAGSTVTISGSFPDEASRLAAVQAFKTAAGTGLVVDDRTTVVPGSSAITPEQASGLGAATPGVTDFTVAVTGGSLTITGTAISDATKAGAENAVKAAFPTWTVTSSITVAAPEGCTALVSQVASYLSGHKLAFSPTSPVLTAASKTAVVQVARLLKTCPTAKVAVNGYTDNQGPDSTSIPLSQARASAVRGALVAAGVENPLTATGFGSANPVGDNRTLAGRAANRRVEIVIT